MSDIIDFGTGHSGTSHNECRPGVSRGVSLGADFLLSSRGNILSIYTHMNKTSLKLLTCDVFVKFKEACRVYV